MKVVSSVKSKEMENKSKIKHLVDQLRSAVIKKKEASVLYQTLVSQAGIAKISAETEANF